MAIDHNIQLNKTFREKFVVLSFSDGTMRVECRPSATLHREIVEQYFADEGFTVTHTGTQKLLLEGVKADLICTVAGGAEIWVNYDALLVVIEKASRDYGAPDSTVVQQFISEIAQHLPGFSCLPLI